MIPEHPTDAPAPEPACPRVAAIASPFGESVRLSCRLRTPGHGTHVGYLRVIDAGAPLGATPAVLHYHWSSR